MRKVAFTPILCVLVALLSVPAAGQPTLPTGAVEDPVGSMVFPPPGSTGQSVSGRYTDIEIALTKPLRSTVRPTLLTRTDLNSPKGQKPVSVEQGASSLMTGDLIRVAG